MPEHMPTVWWRTVPGIILVCFSMIAAFFLVTEHTAHVLGALPYLLLAACPLMHFFMHHGPGVHQRPLGDERDQQGSQRGESS